MATKIETKRIIAERISILSFIAYREGMKAKKGKKVKKGIKK